MYRDTGFSPRRRGLRILAWAILVLAMPLALLAGLHPPNEYQATLGINALDCEGPSETYLFAVPALLIYGAGLVVNGWKWRKRLNAIAAVLCLAVCVTIVVNVTRAVQEDYRQAADCKRL